MYKNKFFRSPHMYLLILILTCYIQEEGNTPLLFACENGLSDVAQLLINKGASVDVTDEVSYMYLCLNIP